MQSKKCMLRTQIFFTLTLSSCLIQAQDKESSGPDVRNPGPDTASFPTSPFTLPKGRSYFENFPLWIQQPGCFAGKTYYWPFLLRYAVANHLELRLTGNGLTHIHDNTDHKKITGISPINPGIKIQFWGSEDWRWLPSVGLEAYIVIPIATANLRDGTQMIINSLYDIELTDSLNLEWNIGAYSTSLHPYKNGRDIYFLINWALQQEINDHLGIYFEGFYTSETYPTRPHELILGAGFISYVTKRVAIYGSYNWSLYKTTMSELANLGFTIAF